jgi:DNA (cytosine-5)-methyltransferase 1
MTDQFHAVDCQAFAGGFTLGMVRAGFKLVGKKEMKGGFGVANCEANRELLGYDWEADVSTGTGEDWTPIPAHVVFGNPPCSGFSLLSRKDFRGADSPVNHCMWAFEWFVARTQPYIAVFESVGQAYSEKGGGRELMQNLRAKLEYDTGMQWNLHHVLHNNASLGGAAIRKRYFWVVSRIPFGIDPVEVTRVPTLMDVIGDLEGLESTWEKQPYRRPPTWWSRPRRSVTGAVCGVQWRRTPAIGRALDLLHSEDITWGQKEIISTVAKRYYEAHGTLPESWGPTMLEKLIAKDWMMGYNQMIRWRGDKMARVVTGGGLDLIMHPTEDRTLTHREVARIQGFPDDWRIRPLERASGLRLTWGKGIPVDCGEWIGTWIRRALEGNPSTYPGEPTGEREWTYDCTNAFRAATSER